MAKFRIKYAGEAVIESDNKINANIRFWDMMDNVDGSVEITDFKVIDEPIERQPESYVMQSDEVCDYCDGYYCSGCREHSNFCGKRVAEVD